MSYRVDIPTLSANEVYTLTFEYEGTETIQLIVGDLTLETTDRRVVFTTTSPVNYIESNVNLTNLNIYEGYYESDDFGGEYTQESYIEGKSLVNYHDFNRCNLTLNNETQSKWEFLDDGFARMTTLDVNYNHCRPKPTNYTSEATYTVATWVRNFNSEAGNVMFECFHYLDTIKTIKLDGSIITGNDSGIHHYSTGQEGLMISVGKYTGITAKIVNGTHHQYMGNFGTTGGFVSGDSVEIFVMVLEGDKADDILNGLIQPFHGIGCVKSPRVISREQPLNMFYCTNWTSTLNNGTVTCQDGKFYFDGSFGGYTWFDIVNGGKVKNNIYLEPGTYYAKMKAHSKEPCAGSSMCVSIEATMENGITLDLCGIYTSKDRMYNQVTQQNRNFTSPIVKLTLKIWYGGNGSNNIIIDGIYFGKKNPADDIAFKENHAITTPNDLELYSLSGVQDTLDLTNGLVTRKIGKLTNCHELISAHSYDANGGFYTARLHWYKVQNIKTSGNQTLALCNVLSNGSYKPNTIWSHGVDGAYYLHFGDCTTLEEAQQYCLDNNLTILYELKEPTTEQLSLNPLKSYKNGSIQTSSQQLAPTLKTTLPVSNKFTTTNLSSGQTYNIYFDGAATKLDAGGTIITNPVSPCEVECGGTTLTIEGTDIQNVRVLETTNKNEVGSINGTTDVELKKMKTYKYENVLDNITYKTSVMNGAVININYDDFCIEFMGAHGWAGEFADTGLKYPSGCNLVHVEFDIDMDNPNLRMAINFNEGIYNSYPQHRHVTLNNDTATIAQGNYENIYTSIITKGHFSRLMYANGDRPIIINLYTGSYIIGILATGNSAEGSIDGYETIGTNYGRITNLRMRIIENFSTNYTTVTSVLRDSSYNIIWQDMDMTIPTTISKLEQPIKLRSLGTTYDSYNPVTGELVKRIGVSETDGSYSVLSSPIVIETRKTEVNGYMADKNTICKEYSKGYEFNTSGQLSAIDIGHYTDYYIKIPENTKTLSFKGMSYYKRIMIYDENKKFIKCYYTYDHYNDATGNITSDMKYVRLTTVKQGSQGRGYGDMRSYLVTDTNYLVFTSDTSLQTLTVPQLYTNGQVKVYSDSEVYPTTILNGQSTNNYEVNGLNTSNNYTIRYDGECESINLANKSNTQGNNVLVKAGATSGNLTFVNDSGDIDNVLLVQNDVREQEINHFTGLQTVEVSGMLIETSQNMWWNDWIAPSEYGASWQVDSPEFIPVQPGETIYVVADNNNYTSLLEFDENYNIVNQGKDLILSNEANPKPINLGNNYYKNYKILSENTRYIKFTIPVGTATTAKNETRWSVISFTRADIGNVPLYTNNTPYRGSIINLPQPVQLNGLPDGTCDTYNPITGEYVQNVGYFVLDDTFASCWLVSTLNGHHYAQRQLSTQEPNYLTLTRDYGFPSSLYDYQAGTKAIANIPIAYSMLNTGDKYPIPSLFGDAWFGNYHLRIALPFTVTEKDKWNYSYTQVNDWLRENPIHIVYKRTEPITTQLTPINIPTFEGGVVQLITTDGKVFPMVEYSMPTNNRYDTSSWETGAVYTQRNMTEAYFNESTTPMTPTETMTLTTDHISSGSIILNDNGNGLIVLKGNYTGRDIPYFTGMRSVEAIEVETTPSPDQPLFGKGGRK